MIQLILFLIVSLLTLVSYSHYQDYQQNQQNQQNQQRQKNNKNQQITEGFDGIGLSEFSKEVENIQNVHKSYGDILNRVENVLEETPGIDDTVYINRINELTDNLNYPAETEYNKFLIRQKRQDLRISELNRLVNQYRKNLNLSNDKINSVKCPIEGVNLNVLDISQNQNNENSNQNNGDPNRNKYLIFVNNNCLSFNGEDSYDLAFCEKTNPKLHFNIKSVNNKKQFNNLVDDHNKVKSGLLEGFPFSTIQPANIESNQSNKKCLNIDAEGLSVQDCTLTQSQRWKPSIYRKSCTH